MTELDQAATDFFKAILETGYTVLGHMDFKIKIEVELGHRPEDRDAAHVVHAAIQHALDIANASARPVEIERTTLQ
jgi:hypothetical protein